MRNSSDDKESTLRGLKALTPIKYFSVAFNNVPQL